eukprot:jgi/Botrbrau1/6335/Bobra.0339s0042.1
MSDPKRRVPPLKKAPGLFDRGETIGDRSGASSAGPPLVGSGDSYTGTARSTDDYGTRPMMAPGDPRSDGSPQSDWGNPMESDRFTAASSTTEMMDAASTAAGDVEQANPAYLYKGPLTPRSLNGGAVPASAPTKSVFGVAGLTGAMQALRKNGVRGSGDNADSSSSSGDSDGEAGAIKGPKPRRRRWLLWGGLGALLLAVLIAIIVGVSLSKRGPAYACDAHVRIRPGSETGVGTKNATVSVTVYNTGMKPFKTPWVITMSGGNFRTVWKTWNMNVTKSTEHGTVEGNVNNSWQTLQPKGLPFGLGMTVEVTNGNGLPGVVMINNVNCEIHTTPGDRFKGLPLSALRTQNGRLVDEKGKEVFLHGINYIGFEYAKTFFDGLTGGRDSLAQDFADVVYRFKLLGFNAVRIPFSFNYIWRLSPDQAGGAQKQPCVRLSEEEVAEATVSPTTNLDLLDKVSRPSLSVPPSRRKGWCNDYVPDESTIHRFLWAVNFLTQNGFYVVLDYQYNYDRSVTDDTGLWVAQWVHLVTRLALEYPDATSRVLLDTLNEPDVYGLGWQAINASMPAAGDLYLEVMDALYPINKNIHFIVQGCGQNGVSRNWGDGFATNASVIEEYGVSDPNPFFKELLQRPYLDNIILGPHVYPPSVYDTLNNMTDGANGPSLWDRLSKSFGYLNKNGYCISGVVRGNHSSFCHVFPVIIGETGTAFRDPRDLKAELDLAAYVRAEGDANDGLHNPLSGFFWWAWGLGLGPGSLQDPLDMGIVAHDWTTIDYGKIGFLQSTGLTPWYTPAESSPTLPVSSATNTAQSNP